MSQKLDVCTDEAIGFFLGRKRMLSNEKGKTGFGKTVHVLNVLGATLLTAYGIRSAQDRKEDLEKYAASNKNWTIEQPEWEKWP